MKVFFDGFDIRGENFSFLGETETETFSIKEKPSLSFSRYSLPYPLLPFFNFAYYPKKFLQKNRVDLIYSFKLFPLNKIPWIADAENFHYLNSFYSYFRRENFFSKKMNYLGLKIIKKALNSNYCRKVVPWSEYAKKTVLSFGGKQLEKKITVCFPAVKCPEQKMKKEREKISLLFAATNPVYKGTEFVFSAFGELRKKYDVELNCFGNFSEKTKKQFPEINFDLVSYKNFSEKVLPENDILLMPSLMESFGFTALQAFASSLPVISSDIMALPEINTENKTGFLVNFPKQYHESLFKNPFSFFHESKKLDKEKIVSKLVEKTSLLIEDSSLRKQLGRNAFNEVQNRKFSVEKRKKSLLEIFAEAIK